MKCLDLFSLKNKKKKLKKKLSSAVVVTGALILILKTPRKTASENVVCLCRLLNILANFSKLFFAYRQTVWTQIRLLLKEQSDLGPHCLQK